MKGSEGVKSEEAAVESKARIGYKPAGKVGKRGSGNQSRRLPWSLSMGQITTF
jgi:hypothetical protein